MDEVPFDLSKRRGATSSLVRKLSVFASLSAEETEYLERLQSEIREFPPHADLFMEGDSYESIYVVREGWAFRYKLLPDGRRQILNFALPGDFVGVRANLFQTAEHSVAAVNDLVVGVFRPQVLFDLLRTHPRIGAAIAWATAREEAMLAEHMLSIGRRSAYERMAHLMMELLRRLQLVGLADDRSFDLPLTQEILADALGLSIVHVNRTLRRLRKDGLIRLQGRRLVIGDVRALSEAAEFQSSYLNEQRLPARTEAKLSNLEASSGPKSRPAV